MTRSNPASYFGVRPNRQRLEYRKLRKVQKEIEIPHIDPAQDPAFVAYLVEILNGPHVDGQALCGVILAGQFPD